MIHKLEKKIFGFTVEDIIMNGRGTYGKKKELLCILFEAFIILIPFVIMLAIAYYILIHLP